MELFILAQQAAQQVAPATTNWSELTALTCVLGAFIWGLTKGLPALLEQFSASLTIQQTDFKEALDKQSATHRTEMAEHRAQSGDLARSGHTTVKNLSESVTTLAHEVREMRIDHEASRSPA